MTSGYQILADSRMGIGAHDAVTTCERACCGRRGSLRREVGPQLHRSADGWKVVIYHSKKTGIRTNANVKTRIPINPTSSQSRTRGNHRGVGRILCASHSTSTAFLTNLESQISNSPRILCASESSSVSSMLILILIPQKRGLFPRRRRGTTARSALAEPPRPLASTNNKIAKINAVTHRRRASAGRQDSISRDESPPKCRG